MMKVLYVASGPVGMSLVRHIQLTQGSRPFNVMDEVNGERTYRAQAWAAGVLIVEDALTACAMLDAAPADVTFTVATGTGNGTGTITVKGLKAIELVGEVTDGTNSGRVVGYAVSWVGEPGNANSAGTAIGHVQNGS